MSENNPKKVSKGVLIGVISIGAVLLAAVIVLILVLVSQAGGSLIGPWHNEEQTRQFTFYEDNKIIISTPYGNFVGEYALDDKTGKGVISMEGASIDFRYEDDEVILETEGVQSKLLSGEITIAISESTTMETEVETSASTDAVTETSDTSASSSETAAVTSETTEAATPSPTPEITVTPTPTTAPETSGMSYMTIFPTFVLFGTPVEGEWVYESSGAMTLTFDSDMTCLMEYDVMGIHSEQDLTYEYNFFTGQGTLIDGSETMEFVVEEDQLTLMLEGEPGIFIRV